MAFLKRLGSPLLVLIIGLLATAAASLLVSRMEGERREARFAGLADAVADSVHDQLADHRLVLRGVAAFFQASKEVGPEEFRDYVVRLRLASNHPGTLGIGYSLKVESAEELARATERMRREMTSDFRPWPPTNRFPASAIILIEPDTRTNRRALGFNMYGEAVRRQAMERAVRTGIASMSGKVQLVQDGRGDNPGFLIYVPVGRKTGARPGTAAYDAEGWAYSPLRAREIVGAALSRPGLEGARVALFDGRAEPANLLFDNRERQREGLSAERVIEFGGRSWRLQVSPAPAFFDKEHLSLGWAVALGGVLLSFLIAALAWQQAQAKALTEREIQRATGELRRSNSELIEASRAREEAEAQLRQSQKLEAIGQLTGGIAHDFNNMLAVILGNLDLAQRRISEPDRLARALANAQEGARRAAELTQRLLAFGRRQPLVPKLLDLNRLVGDMLELLRRTLGEQITLETRLTGGPWPVEADAGQLENAILNLSINARDAMPKGGTLTIETHNCQLDETYASGNEGVKAGDYVLVSITDTGSGMAPDVVARAFDPFFTTKEVGKGTGLGLSMVFGFVRQSDGHLKIYSEVGKGTTVKLYLPRAHGEVVEEAGAPEVRDIPRGRPEEIVLVAEDQDDVRLTTVESLRELGYTVVHAASGAEALELLHKHGGATLLLTDVVMPGMNGQELVRQAVAAFPSLRVVFTTGYTADAIVTEGRLDQGIDLLPKPFTTAELATRIRSAIDRPTAS